MISEYADLSLDLVNSMLKGPAGSHYLSNMLRILLATLIEAKGEVVLITELTDKFWQGKIRTRNAIYRQVFELRSLIKLVGSDVDVVTKYGIGFKLTRK
jgi:DNA-binding winged helix-turn-helix (wHTH) protein